MINFTLITENIVLIISLLIIIVGLMQGKKNQDGLTALTGGNQELFAIKKERGFDWFLSILTLLLGSLLFILSIVIRILMMNEG